MVFLVDEASVFVGWLGFAFALEFRVYVSRSILWVSSPKEVENFDL